MDAADRAMMKYRLELASRRAQWRDAPPAAALAPREALTEPPRAIGVEHLQRHLLRMFQINLGRMILI